MKQYLYINISDLKVVKCSPVNKPPVGQVTIEVDDTIANIFKTGHIGEINNYVITRNDDTYSIVPKQVFKHYVNQKIATGILQEATYVDDADCTITINNVNQTINLTLEILRNTSTINYTSDDIDHNTKYVVYITKKNDPSYLLFYVTVPLIELLQSGATGVTMDMPGKYIDVSVYTRYVSSTYSLEFINE